MAPLTKTTKIKIGQVLSHPNIAGRQYTITRIVIIQNGYYIYANDGISDCYFSRADKDCCPEGVAVGWELKDEEEKLPDTLPAKALNVPLVNDYVCPTCKTNRVSLAEKNSNTPCWNCGNKL